MDELKAFANKKLEFAEESTLASRNQNRIEVFGQFQISKCKGSQEWEECWTEIEPKLTLETIRQTPLQHCYMYVRLCLILGYFASLTVPLFLSIPLYLLSGVLKKKSRIWRRMGIMDFMNRLLVRISHQAVGLEVEYTGSENTLDHISIVLYNHASNSDPPIVQSGNFPRIMLLFVGKHSLIFLPILGLWWWAQGHVYINRNKRKDAISVLNHLAKSVMEQNMPVCFAPEGTRSRNGHLQEFKKGAFHLQKTMKCAIVPAYIAGAYEAWSPKHLFYRMTRVAITYDPAITINNEKETTDDVRERIQKMYHERRHLAYRPTTCGPVSWPFFLKHLAMYPLVYLQFLFQMWLWRKMTSYYFSQQDH